MPHAATTAPKEEYLQAIWTLGDESGQVFGARVAGFLGVSAASVSEMVHRLEREDLVRQGDRHEILLTPSGRELAERIVRRHRLIERMLTDLLGYEWWATHDEAERLEHAISPEMERRLIERLGHPETCPHGNPMPGVKAAATRPLESVPVGDVAEVARIPDQFEHEPGFLRYLDEQGVRPGVAVRVVARTPLALTVELNGARRDIRSDCDLKVWVRGA